MGADRGWQEVHAAQLRSCSRVRFPPQRGAEQGHLEAAGVWQDGDARQEVDRTRGGWVCRPAGGDPQLALWHFLVVECKVFEKENLWALDSKKVFILYNQNEHNK